MPDAPFLIRRTTADDAPALAQCRTDLFLELGQLPHTDDRAEFETLCEIAIGRFDEKGLATAWLAESTTGQSVLGSIILLRYPRLPAPRNAVTSEGYIVSVYVIPAWRRKGVARALTDAVVTFARESGMGRLRLHATSGGRAVYEGAGFVARDDAMELDLTPFGDE